MYNGTIAELFISEFVTKYRTLSDEMKFIILDAVCAKHGSSSIELRVT